MTPQTPDKPSPDPILRGLREVMPRLVKNVRPFDRETGLNAYLEADGAFDGYDTVALTMEVEKRFGFRCGDYEWECFFRADTTGRVDWVSDISPRITFGDLADFIANQIAVISLEPVTVLGKPCKTAAAFRAIQHVARQLRPKVKGFAPSTPIRDRVRGLTCEDLWARLERVTDGRTPGLRTTWLTKLTTVVRWGGVSFILLAAGGAALLGIAGAVLGDDVERITLLGAGLAASLTLSLLLGLLLAGAIALLAWFDDRLPVGIRTFGDLARAIAATEPEAERSHHRLPSDDITRS